MFVPSCLLFVLALVCLAQSASRKRTVTAGADVYAHYQDCVVNNDGFICYGLSSAEVIEKILCGPEDGSISNLASSLPTDSCVYIVGHVEYDGADTIILIVWNPANSQTCSSGDTTLEAVLHPNATMTFHQTSEVTEGNINDKLEEHLLIRSLRNYMYRRLNKYQPLP